MSSIWTHLPTRPKSEVLKLLVATLGVILFMNFSAHANGQAPTQGPDPSDSSPNAGSMSQQGMSNGGFRMDPAEVARRRQMQRAEIRQSIASDTATLLKLAQELNDEINQQAPEMLTQAELKKYAEIGKLAHRLKAEMKDFGTSGTSIQPLPGLVPAPDPKR